MAVLANIVNPMVQPSIVTIAMKGTTSSSSIALTHILEWLSLSLPGILLFLTAVIFLFLRLGEGLSSSSGSSLSNPPGGDDRSEERV